MSCEKVTGPGTAGWTASGQRSNDQRTRIERPARAIKKRARLWANESQHSFQVRNVTTDRARMLRRGRFASSVFRIASSSSCVVASARAPEIFIPIINSAVIHEFTIAKHRGLGVIVACADYESVMNVSSMPELRSETLEGASGRALPIPPHPGRQPKIRPGAEFFAQALNGWPYRFEIGQSVRTNSITTTCPSDKLSGSTVVPARLSGKLLCAVRERRRSPKLSRTAKSPRESS